MASASDNLPATATRQDALLEALNQRGPDLVQYGPQPLTYEGHSYAGSSVNHAINGFEGDPGGDDQLIQFVAATAAINPVTFTGVYADRFILYGDVVGVAWRRDSTTPEFTLVVDGMAWACDGGYTLVDGTAMAAAVFDDYAQLVVRGLGPGPHEVAIHLNAATSGGNKTLNIYGFLVDRRAGYRERPPTLGITDVSTLTTALLAIPRNTGTNKAFRGTRKVLYTNTSGADVTVTIAQNGTTIWTMVIAAGASDSFDPGGNAMLNSVYTHKASANAAINATVLGGA